MRWRVSPTRGRPRIPDGRPGDGDGEGFRKMKEREERKRRSERGVES